MAGISGKNRRELLVFLWTVVMGLSNTLPDNDEFLQLLPKTDKFQRLFLGVNAPPTEAARSLQDIEEISRLGFSIGSDLINLFKCKPNTKTHRLMHHLHQYLVDFGCARKGSTDENEKLHKISKWAYRATNKHLVNLAPQLLSARALVVAKEEEGQENIKKNLTTNSIALAQLLITRHIPSQVDAHCKETGEHHSTNEGQRTRNIAEDMQRTIPKTSTVEHAEQAILSALQPTTNGPLWNLAKSVTFQAKLPWWPGNIVSQTAYAGKSVFQTVRRDCVAYEKNSIGYKCIIQSIFAHYTLKTSRVALIRRLKYACPEEGNREVVLTYGHKRYEYDQSECDVVLDCVPADSFVCLVTITVDPWCVSKRYGTSKRVQELPDTHIVRRHLAFFEVMGYKFSSFHEQE